MNIWDNSLYYKTKEKSRCNLGQKGCGPRILKVHVDGGGGAG